MYSHYGSAGGSLPPPPVFTTGKPKPAGEYQKDPISTTFTIPSGTSQRGPRTPDPPTPPARIDHCGSRRGHNSCISHHSITQSPSVCFNRRLHSSKQSRPREVKRSLLSVVNSRDTCQHISRDCISGRSIKSLAASQANLTRNPRQTLGEAKMFTDVLDTRKDPGETIRTRFHNNPGAR